MMNCDILCLGSFLLYFCILFFFFFKQKTAYEMRISDWSSDVCSSDLVVAGALENLKLAVLIVCQRESLRRAHADFVFLEGFENGRVQRRQLQHAADIGGGDRKSVV